MEVCLTLKENEVDYKEFALCSADGDVLSTFYVEIEKDTALISYDTSSKHRNKGYASKGLRLVRQALFEDDNILFLELINLSGDYSRKVAENAGFFSPNNSIDYYVALNERAEEILNNKLSSLDASSSEHNNILRKLNKVNSKREQENKAIQKLRNELKKQSDLLEIADDEEYKQRIQAEIHHLTNILESTDQKNKEL